MSHTRFSTLTADRSAILTAIRRFARALMVIAVGATPMLAERTHAPPDPSDHTSTTHASRTYSPPYAVTISPHAHTANPPARVIARGAPITPCSGTRYSIDPCSATVSTPLLQSGALDITVTSNNGWSTTQSVWVDCTGTSITNYRTSDSEVTVPEDGSVTVTVYWDSQYQGSAHASVHVGIEVADIDITVTGANHTLTIDPSFINYEYQAACAMSCFAATLSHNTVPFYTMDAPRSISVARHEDRAHPRPFIYADVTPEAGASISSYTMSATLNGSPVTFVNGEQTLSYLGSGYGERLAAQLDASGLATGVYPLVLTVTAHYTSGDTCTATQNTKLLVVNDDGSSIARGWTVAGLQRVYAASDGSYVVTDGPGGVRFPFLGGPALDFSTLDSDGGSGYIRAYSDSTKVYFDAAGREWKVQDILGHTTTFQYDGQGRLIAAIDPVRNAGSTTVPYLSLGYGTYGLATVSEIGGRGPGRTTTYSVDASRNLTAITDPDGRGTIISYDGAGRLSTVHDRQGGTTTYGYAPSWKLASSTLPSAPVDAGSGTTTPRAAVTTFVDWQSIGVPYGPTTGVPAAPAGRPDATITNALSHTTSLRADKYGQPLVMNDPLGNSTAVAYNGILPTSVSRSYLGTDQYEYNGPHLVSSTPSGGSTTYYHYGVASQVDSVWGAAAVAEYRQLNADGTVAWARHAGSPSRVDHYTYDPVTKRVASMTDANSVTTTYAYDPATWNLLQSNLPTGAIQSTIFDAYGRDSVQSTSGLAASTTIYDVLNRPVTRFDGVNPNPASVTYDPAGDSYVTITDPKGQVYCTEYDVLGRTTIRYDAAGAGAYDSYRYDILGRPASNTNRRGQRIDRTFDALGRVLSETAPDGTATFSYDANGTHTTATNGLVTDSTFVDVLYHTDSTVTWVGGRRYVMAHNAPDAFTQNKTATTAEPTFSATRVIRPDPYIGLPLALTLGPDSLRYSYGISVPIRTTTTYVDGSQRNDSFTIGYQLLQSAFTSPTVDAYNRRAYRYDIAGRIVTEQWAGAAGYPYGNPSGTTEQRQFTYDLLGRLTGVDTRHAQPCNVWPAGGGSCWPGECRGVLNLIKYDQKFLDPNYKGNNPRDRFHNFSKANDLHIIWFGRVVRTEADGYVVRAIPGRIGDYTGFYAIGYYPRTDGPFGYYVTHRFFMPNR